MNTTIATETAFAVHDYAFLDALGSDPRLELVVRTDAHEGPVYAAGRAASGSSRPPARSSA
jgi:hypothetical protein